MGRLIRWDEFDTQLIRDLPLLDSEFDEAHSAMEEDYERALLSSPQPHHFTPSSRS